MSEDKLMRGVVIPLPTVFDADGEVDIELMKQLIKFYLDAKVNGFFVCGSFGMGPAMRTDQRKQVVELVAEQVDGRVPFVTHCGAVDTFTAIELAKHAEQAGSTAVALVPPFYYNDHTDYEILEHYRQTANAVHIPMFIYDHEKYTGIHMRVDRVLWLKKEIPSIRGVKLNMMGTGRALGYLRQLPQDVAVFTGSVQNLLAGKPIGFDGVINPATAHVPELTVNLWNALEHNKYEDAVHYHHQADTISGTLQGLWGKKGRSAHKEALKLRGFDIKMFPRYPSQDMNAEDLEALRSVHEEVGVEWALNTKEVRN